MLTREQYDKWIADLTSDAFKQTTGCLGRVGGGNCCLGVLATQFDSNPRQRRDIWEYNIKGDGYRTTVPEDVLPQGVRKHLMGLNDGRGYSFRRIAEYIIANPDLFIEPDAS